ncbi:MAG: low molecular weight protein arginine phosphatase [Planctomycetota bacterium]
MRTVLFICTGNTCRSPMAEGIAQKLADDGRFPKEVGQLFFASAGVSAFDGASTSHETVEVLERMKAPVPEHSKRLTAEMIRKADLVLGMTESHVARARAMVAGDATAQSKVQPLDPDGDVGDPIGMGQRAYDDLGAYFAELIPSRIAEMLKP